MDKYITKINLNLDLDSVYQDLCQERYILERCWSRLTAHPKTLFARKSPISKGQCFVTSMHLFYKFNRYLAKKHLITIKRGFVENKHGSILIEDHCWIEIGSKLENDRLIIDLTADQSDEISDKILISFKSLSKDLYGLRYVEQRNYNENDLYRLSFNTKIRFSLLLDEYDKYKYLIKKRA